MILALAVLLFQPQALPQPTSQPEQSSVATASNSGETSSAPFSPAGTASTDAGSSSTMTYEPEHVASLPAAPSPSSGSGGSASSATPAPSPYVIAPNMTTMMVSVEQLREEAWRKRRIWYGLALASHSAAGFDAWTTNHEIAAGQGRELDPLMKPFAGNPSIYVATQVGPAILDYVGKRMMFSRRSWIRSVWWLPQALGTAGSFASGAHNLTLHAATTP